ncbi:MAG: TolC family protein [Candidatus Zixiibacteriota bacterium]
MAFAVAATDLFAAQLNDASKQARLIEQNFDSAKSNQDLTSIEDYLTFADANSPAIRAAFYKWKASLEQVSQASLPDPMLMYSFNPDNFKTDNTMPEYMIGVSQEFPWLGTIGAGKDAAFARSQAEYEAFQSERYKLHFMIKRQLYEFYLLNREISIVRDNIYLLESWEAVARAGYTAGEMLQSDLLMAQVELGKMKTQLASLEDKVNPYKETIRSLVFLPDSIDVVAPENIPDTLKNIDEELIRSAILQSNPDLKSMTNMISMEKNMMKQASRMNYPMFNIGLDYKSAGASMNQDMSREPQDSWMVKVGMSLPIWFGRNKARTGEARARLMESEYKQLDYRNQIEAMTAEKLFDLRDAGRQIGLYQSGLISLAEQSLKTAYKSYEAGELEFINVIQAQRQLLDFVFTLEQAKVDYAMTRAELEMMMGRDMEYLEIQHKE